jgi:stage II sporulation protein M
MTAYTNLKTIFPYAIAMGFIYIATLSLGYLVGVTTPVVAQVQAANFQATQGNMIIAQSSYIQVLLIFLTNTGIGMIMMMLGYMVAQTTGLWIGTLIMAPIQAYKTGAIMAHIGTMTSKGPSFLLVAILPHGVLELSASFLAMGIGLMLGYHISMKRCEDPQYQGTAMIKKWWNVYYKLIIPMYFVAAIIEVYITPVLIYAALH